MLIVTYFQDNFVFTLQLFLYVLMLKIKFETNGFLSISIKQLPPTNIGNFPSTLYLLDTVKEDLFDVKKKNLWLYCTFITHPSPEVWRLFTSVVRVLGYPSHLCQTNNKFHCYTVNKKLTYKKLYIRIESLKFVNSVIFYLFYLW